MKKYFIKLLVFASLVNFCTVQNIYSMGYFDAIGDAFVAAGRAANDGINFVKRNTPQSVKALINAQAEALDNAFKARAARTREKTRRDAQERVERAIARARQEETDRVAREAREVAVAAARQQAAAEMNALEEDLGNGDPKLALLQMRNNATRWDASVEEKVAYQNACFQYTLAEEAKENAKDLEQYKADLESERIAEEFKNKMTVMAAEVAKDEAAGKRQAAEAKLNRKHSAQMFNAAGNLLKDLGGSIKENPHLYVGAIVTIIAAGYASKEGFALASRRLERYLSLPKIVKETNVESVCDKLQNLIFSSYKKQSSLKEIVLQPKVQNFMEQYATRLKGAIENDLVLRGLILHGRPGTGKTLLAGILSRMLGIPYYILSAASLFQLSTEEALQEITKLFENAKSQKCIIFLDEAELIFPNRKNTKGISEDVKKVLNHFLSYTGETDKTTDFVLILATNLLDQFDDAFLSRCDILAIDAPNITERKSMIEMYIKKYLKGKICNRQASLLQKLLGIEPKSIKINIDADALDTEQINNIAKETEGFVGRDIVDLILDMQRATVCSKNKRLTKKIVDSIVEIKVAQAKAKLDIMHKHDAVAA